MKRTKILCTIGPASQDLPILRRMVKAGMDGCRLNFSHGTYEHHKMLISNIRQVASEAGVPLAIVQDLQGPRIRVGKLPAEGITLNEKDLVIFTVNPKYKDNYKDNKIFVTCENLPNDLKSNDYFLLVDGLIKVQVVKVEGNDIHCKVLIGGILNSNKGLNFPETKLSISALSDKDKEDVKFGVQMGVDWVALSFVTSAKEVYDLRYLIKKYEKQLNLKSEHSIKIISKIEKRDAITNIDEIIQASDGIMIARGDLGIEIPAEEVPLKQKEIITKCMAASKPVIVATQMMESMINNSRPTRAEVNDVANSVIDHTDVVMLSGESANGKYPVETVEFMAKIIKKTEQSVYDDLTSPMYGKHKTISDIISFATTLFTMDRNVKLVLVASISGLAGKMVSRFRPELPIMVATMDYRVQRQLNLSWGVVPFMLPTVTSLEEFNDRAIGYLKKFKYAKRGDQILIVAGEPVGISNHMNLLEIREVM
jgi:pyruvate kinase